MSDQRYFALLKFEKPYSFYNTADGIVAGGRDFCFSEGFTGILHRPGIGVVTNLFLIECDNLTNCIEEFANAVGWKESCNFILVSNANGLGAIFSMFSEKDVDSFSFPKLSGSSYAKVLNGTLAAVGSAKLYEKNA